MIRFGPPHLKQKKITPRWRHHHHTTFGQLQANIFYILHYLYYAFKELCDLSDMLLYKFLQSLLELSPTPG